MSAEHMSQANISNTNSYYQYVYGPTDNLILTCVHRNPISVISQIIRRYLRIYRFIDSYVVEMLITSCETDG